MKTTYYTKNVQPLHRKENQPFFQKQDRRTSLLEQKDNKPTPFFSKPHVYLKTEGGPLINKVEKPKEIQPVGKAPQLSLGESRIQPKVVVDGRWWKSATKDGRSWLRGKVPNAPLRRALWEIFEPMLRSTTEEYKYNTTEELYQDLLRRHQVATTGQGAQAPATTSPQNTPAVPRPSQPTTTGRSQASAVSSGVVGAVATAAAASGATSAVAGGATAQALPRSVVDNIVSNRILAELDRFRFIPIEVTGLQPKDVWGLGSLLLPTTKTVHVHADYFINTDSAKEFYKSKRDPRGNLDFKAVVGAMQEESVIKSTSANVNRSVGRAIELGKATPNEIKAFVEKAIEQGVIRKYAENLGVLSPEMNLVDMEESDLEIILQQWINEVGVGVDCSGFVLQVVNKAREDLIKASGFWNEHFGGKLGLPFMQTPDAVTSEDWEERSANSFKEYEDVKKPVKLRPGDVWLVNKKSSGSWGHIRIVTDAREVEENGVKKIEFTTAESSGGSKKALPGPVDSTWRTFSLEVFNPIEHQGSVYAPDLKKDKTTKGQFHRPF